MSGHAPSPSPRYRPEIDGMRAVAVMMVVFHHADFAWASGGFIGVDIFFVLSGHVITVLALDAMETGRFSIVDFYERRARRIMPALIVMCASLLAPAYWLMLPGQLIAFGRNLVATLLLYSN
ncbi:acyltransferase family protein, partial [Rhizorhabdus sp.]|uniref:acyltransferase family protein n=1 Tax=Rhizorhabdus sp. TaxID=1968843 RepID=UPI0035ADEE2B